MKKEFGNINYREGAEKFYDLFGEKDDGPFYIELAHEHGDKALELGVGTTRLAIQLAREGIETWGIDNSPHMLKAANKNVENEPPEIRSLIHLEHADVRDFDLRQLFDLIYFPSFSFDHLLEIEDQKKALVNIKRHLAPDGIYAFDLAHASKMKKDSGWFVQRKRLGDHKIVVRTGYHNTDLEKRLMSLNLWYELFEDSKMVERYFEGADTYVHTPEGIKELLQDTGYEILAWYGGHEKQKFTDKSEMMVIVARSA